MSLQTYNSLKMIQSKVNKALVIAGSSLLIVMSLFHSSGILYISDLMNKTNSESFLKEIFPVLFVHPSVQLLGLGILGIITLFMKYETKKVRVFIGVFVFLDALFALYLSAMIPSIVLAVAAMVFFISSSLGNKSLKKMHV